MAKPEEARRSHDKAGKGKDGRQSKDKDKPFRRAKADDDADAAVLMSDERFAKIMRDPRFRKPKKDKTKVDIDERFSKMLDNEEFSYVAKVDKYGRKLKDKKGEDLRKYYRLSKENEVAGSKKDKAAPTKEEPEVEDEDEEVDVEEAEGGRQWDFARGEGPMYSSSEEDDDEEEAEEEALSSDEEGSQRGGADDLLEFEEDDIYDRIGPFANEEIPMGDETRRIAVVNMDWDNIRAKDLFKVMASFAPTGGKVVSVKIYPSEFGKERLAHEALHGPPAEIFGGAAAAGSAEDNADGDDAEDLLKADSGEEFDAEKLRLYQLERLRYYYAIIECDSTETAKAIYDTCDGTEFEKTSNFFDMRFVPDEEEFEDEPKESMFENPTGYKPVEFVTKALQHSKVELTWDQDPAERVKAIRRRKFTKDDLADMDFQAYLGSDSEDDAEEEERRKKYRDLLLGGVGGADGEEEAEEMEITFTPGLEGKVQDLVNDKMGGKKGNKDKKDKKDKKKAAKAAGSDDDEDAAAGAADQGEPDLGFDDPFFLEAENPKAAKKLAKEQRKKQKGKPEADPEQEKAKAELELLLADETGQQSRHFDMKEVMKAEKKNKKKKNKNKGQAATQDDFEVDVADPRFAAMLNSSAFAVDTTSSNFKDTSNMRKLLAARKNKPSGGDSSWTVNEDAPPKDELASLVANVKRKATMSNGSDGAGKAAKKQKMGNMSKP